MTGEGKLGFDSGEGALEMATTSKECKRRVNLSGPYISVIDRLTIFLDLVIGGTWVYPSVDFFKFRPCDHTTNRIQKL